jgi:hypothetical protein
VTGPASIVGAARLSSLGGDIKAAGSIDGSMLSDDPGAESATVSSSARPKGRGLSAGSLSDMGAISTLGARLVIACGTAVTGAGGRITELVVSLDGFCKSKASTPAVDEQPARHSDATKKLTTPGIRIWTCTQNTTDRGQNDSQRTNRISYE